MLLVVQFQCVFVFAEPIHSFSGYVTYKFEIFLVSSHFLHFFFDSEIIQKPMIENAVQSVIMGNKPGMAQDGAPLKVQKEQSVRNIQGPTIESFRLSCSAKNSLRL